MQTRVQKWGNSLALRIPKPFAVEVGLSYDTPVEMSLTEGKLVITPLKEQVFVLEELLTQINESNLHYEVDTGPAVGGEIW